jgi:hypothetical protein
MKTIAYTALHYGRDYLASAIRSVIDHVDEYWVLYSATGSHGTWIDEPCPEHEVELTNIAYRAAGNKLRWVNGDWQQEGQQRDTIHRLAPDAERILVLDADEIWRDPAATLAAADATNAGRVRVSMVHFWRSFYRAVLHDPAYPERVIYPQRAGKATVHAGGIAHMGYAQRLEIVAYKMKIHGHRAELRTDVDWFRDVYAANRQYDCHPVGSEYWNPETVNPREYMPAWMLDHAYADMEVIE